MRPSDTLRLPWLDPAHPQQAFPPVDTALHEPNGLLALGGDLSPARLLNAYRHGIFPWYSGSEPILWWSPNPRCVFRPDSIRVSGSFRKALNKKDYSITMDRDFDAVIAACAEPRAQQQGTWLTPAMMAAYRKLHHEGWAHSVEVWRDDVLIGGIYGIALGRAFFGESMFSRAPNGSKIALAWLARQLHAWDFTLLDGQVGSPHLYTLGAIDLSREAFIGELQQALGHPDRRGHWTFDIVMPATD